MREPKARVVSLPLSPSRRRLVPRTLCVTVALILIAAAPAHLGAQSVSCADEAEAARGAKSPSQLRESIAALRDRAEGLSLTTRERALHYCVIAELMQRLGDPQAREFYGKALREALDSDPAGAEYALLFADYLRNIRGPRQPLHSEAERFYHEALRTLAQSPSIGPAERDRLGTRIRRGLISLYERDGMPLLGKIGGTHPPFLFFSSQATFARLLDDPDEIDEARDFTSEAMFAASRDRLNRPLTREELRALVRIKEHVETFSRLRARVYDLPALDVYWQYRDVDNAQITNFFLPTRFNDVTVSLFGGGLEKAFDAYPLADILVRADVRQIRREGLVEFRRRATEDVLSLVGKTVLSRFIGPDKISLETSVVRDDIDQNVATPITRRVFIVAPTLRYELFRPLFGDPFAARFEPRRSELYLGASFNTETFGTVDVQKNDYFVGFSLKDFRGLSKDQSLDITIQPTLFTSERSGTDASRRPVDPLENRQYRTAVTLLYRLIDEEKTIKPTTKPTTIPSLPFLHLVLLGSHDTAVQGPRDFESFRAGVGLDAKLIAEWLQGGTTFLASARYEFQRFYHLNRDEHLFSVSLKMGF